MSKLLTKIFYIAGCFIILGLVVSWNIAGRLVASVPVEIFKPQNNLPVDAIKLNSDSGSVISGWHLRHENSKGVVLLFHGIRANRLSMLKRAEMLFSHGYSSVLIDFQAHGQSSGEKITIGYLEKFDVKATIEFAKKHHAGEPVGVIGVSMGGAASLLASPLQVDALVIESVYPDIESAIHNRVKKRLGFLSWLPSKLLLAQLEPRLDITFSDLRPIDALKNVDSPIFVISGSDDLHTTSEETKRMFAEAKEPKSLWVVSGLGHEDVHSNNPEEYEQKVLAFLKGSFSRGKFSERARE